MNSDEEHRVLALVSARTPQARREALANLKRCRASEGFRSEVQLAWSRVGHEPTLLDMHPADQFMRRMEPGPEPIGMHAEAAQWMRHWAHAVELMAAGARPPGPLLLHGPTGAGKTTTAAWIGVQLGLPIFVLDVHDVVRSHMGESGERLAKSFKAVGLDSTLVLEEIDGMGMTRAGGDGAGREYATVTIALMRLLEDAKGPVIATTNRRDELDVAVVRRFDAVVEVVEPDVANKMLIAERLSGEPVPVVLLREMSMPELVRRSKLHRRLAVLGENAATAWG